MSAFFDVETRSNSLYAHKWNTFFKWKRQRLSLSRTQKEPLFYLATLACFEAISVLGDPVVGNALHALLMMWLVFRGSTHKDSDSGRLLLCLSVCPMIRLVSLAISPSAFPGMWYYIIPEGIVLIAGFFTMRVCSFSLKMVGLRVDRFLWTTPLVLLGGILIGWVEAHVVSASSLVPGLAIKQVWLPVILLIIFTGFSEEFIFRGLIQSAAKTVYTPWMGITYTAVTWTCLHVGWYSWVEMLLVFGVGLLWGTTRHMNKSIISLTFSHGLCNIMLFIIIPHLK